jgi:Bifunctional DNA primase/polymerase, N-terminal
MPSPLAHALHLAKHGLRVFPCRNKRPCCPGGFKSASNSGDEVRALWARYPAPQVGVACDAKFCVLDLDLQHVEAQRWHEENCDRLPLTRTHETPSGGRHLLFKPHPDVKCTAGKIAPHIDTRGAGGYLIWWPACGLAVTHNNALAAFPDLLMPFLKPKPAPIVASPSTWEARRKTQHHAAAKLTGIITKVVSTQQGNRNAILFWAAARVRDMAALGEIGRAEQDDAVAALLRAGMEIGLPLREVERTIRSGIKP